MTIVALGQDGYKPSLLVSPYRRRVQREEEHSTVFWLTRMRKSLNSFLISLLATSVKRTVTKAFSRRTILPFLQSH